MVWILSLSHVNWKRNAFNYLLEEPLFATALPPPSLNAGWAGDPKKSDRAGDLSPSSFPLLSKASRPANQTANVVQSEALVATWTERCEWHTNCNRWGECTRRTKRTTRLQRLPKRKRDSIRLLWLMGRQPHETRFYHGLNKPTP